MVREACITVAYMSQELHHKVDHFCETVLPTLVNLIPNTAKVMASAGVVAIRFMVQNTHHHRLVPLLTREMASKSREIRRTLCEFLDQLVHTWPTHSMEKHAALIAEALRKGITDADPEARAFARKYVARPQPVGATPGARTPRSSASLSLLQGVLGLRGPLPGGGGPAPQRARPQLPEDTAGRGWRHDDIGALDAAALEPPVR